ncbi:YetF domain-containing protein [Pelagicoccus sp. SDUM812002]|uniref:DUF421 domain-containing protein n=1 Tax=Pelagicoccus sp. SDUM812002 TaxID=3041266 RepID=UPI00280D0024|nr:YetF domain-containing protein [Pelagicoccus sp. SDUM812002]MDQ8185797.1 DUF421 domain-containing protein [Pelagicoccus sp. SDUM812002]
MDKLFFDGTEPLLRTLIIGVAAYACLMLVLRISGKRTLSKMNAFDFIITVALGSTLATILLSKDVSLAQGVLALALLVCLQYVITWSSVRAPWIRRLVTGEPRLLLYQGKCLPKAMRSSRVAEEEIRAAVRSSGNVDLNRVFAVVLETDGSFSVTPSAPEGSSANALAGLQHPEGTFADK